MRPLIATAFALLTTVSAMAEPQDGALRRLDAAYDFAIGGLSIGRVVINAEVDGEGYVARTAMHTRGMLDMMLRGRLEAEARGRGVHPAAFEPERYETRYGSRMGEQLLELTWRDRRPTGRNAAPPLEDRPYDINPLKQDGTLDPVSGLAAIFMPLADTTVCNRTIPVFDGRRRYDLILAEPRTIAETTGGASAPEWHEPLIHCLGIYERIAGFEPDVMEKGRFFAFDIWFEQPRNGVSRAVRIGGKTRLGYAIGDLDRS